MTYDFDQIINRKNTNSIKWNKYGDRDILPLWVADMDFQVAKPIKDALQKITDHNLYGYSQEPNELTEVVIKRLKEKHDWEIQKEWIIWLPGLVPGIYTSCRAVGKENDAVMTATPVYHHFVDGPLYSNRQVQEVPMLVDENGHHTFDFEAIKNSITDQTKLFLLCNPHNPNGRVFSRSELQTLAYICLENNIVICSDEIHCDLILDKTKKHISIASMSKTIENQTITLLSPSKTFNIAGLGCSFAVIPNEELRANFRKAKFGMMPMVTAFSYAAALAAYKEGNEWHEQMIEYLIGNQEYLVKEINQIGGMKMSPLEATYLAWINTENTILTDSTNISEYFENIGIGISDAQTFHGKGYFRLNFATQRSILEETIERLKKGFN